MKQKITQSVICSCIALCILMQSSASFAAGTKNDDPKEKKEAKKAKVSSSRNNSSVRIYPDIVRRVMHVAAKDDNEGTGIDFFVFDLTGNIVKHYKMKSGDHEDITGLERGKYVFRVFSGDEETATGNIDIR
jgi:hypothetical protein